jgi:hypothetical protein
MAARSFVFFAYSFICFFILEKLHMQRARFEACTGARDNRAATCLSKSKRVLRRTSSLGWSNVRSARCEHSVRPRWRVEAPAWHPRYAATQRDPLGCVAAQRDPPAPGAPSSTLSDASPLGRGHLARTPSSSTNGDPRLRPPRCGSLVFLLVGRDEGHRRFSCMNHRRR